MKSWRSWFSLVIASVLISVTGALGQEEAEALSPVEIVRRCDELLRGEQSFCRLAMTITRPGWTRSLEMEAWTRGTEDSFIRVLSPPREKGVTFLKRGREAWQYVPSIDRVIKIPPSMMLQSWLGSDFTNDDLVRADSIVADYTHAILSHPSEGDAPCWLIEARPRPRAPVVWGRVEIVIRKQDYIPVRIDYVDEAGKLVKSCKTSDYVEVEGRRLATRLVMHDLSRPGNNTTIQYKELTFRPDIGPDTFTLRNLRE